MVLEVYFLNVPYAVTDIAINFTKNPTQLSYLHLPVMMGIKQRDRVPWFLHVRFSLHSPLQSHKYWGSLDSIREAWPVDDLRNETGKAPFGYPVTIRFPCQKQNPIKKVGLGCKPNQILVR